SGGWGCSGGSERAEWQNMAADGQLIIRASSGRNFSRCHRPWDRSLQAFPTAARSGRSQQVRHPFVAGPVTRPSFGGGVMAIVLDRELGTVIYYKPHAAPAPMLAACMN